MKSLKIIRRLSVPTGDILVVQGESGLLECLSLGDYGKHQNVKADFMGITREIDGVKHTDLMPLSEKWVITISNSTSCKFTCRFCDCPRVPRPATNATFSDLLGQVQTAIDLHPEIEHTKRINVHFARIGEPTTNPNVLDATIYMAGYFKQKKWGFHPVVSTMMPVRHASEPDYKLVSYINRWMYIKNEILEGNAGLQLSINTTDEKARERLFGGWSLPLVSIGNMMKDVKVVGRKIALNFAISEYPVDGSVLSKYFDPSKFMCKITPMHQTKAAEKNNIRTDGGYEYYYPYKEAEESLKSAGYDVIVFVPSIEEDLGRITCGNAILSGTLPDVPYTEIVA